MGDLIGAAVSLLVLLGLGYLCYQRGFVGTWDGLKGAFYDMLNPRVPSKLITALMYGKVEPLPDPRPPVDRQRTEILQRIADVPMEEIIAAAERRATHPDEPLPQILADLDPETRERPVDSKPSGVQWIAVTPDTSDLAYRLKPLLLRGRKPMVLPSGMDYRVVPVKCTYLGCEMEASHCSHAWTPAMPGAVITTKRVERAPAADPYAKCTHPDADRAEIRSCDSGATLKILVTGCRRCDLAAISAELTSIANRSIANRIHFTAATISGADMARYRQLVDEGHAIKAQLVDAEPEHWPGRMF